MVEMDTLINKSYFLVVLERVMATTTCLQTLIRPKVSVL